ncbi:MAG: Rieske 2Fe-2S domain-containing protein [Chloroflexi bacterium]|nr:Rieske 2Fe-2S domain-containing protein [Chloroflexota bacterium]MYC46717.1 Rieske 2Fe-2S domain-containing protein [Chloroflexota bacterium]
MWHRLAGRFSSRRRPSQPGPSPGVRQDSYPPPFPDGWYRIAGSAEIKPGQVKYVECLGKQIALFRSGNDGSIHAIEAFCPHMGANLADGSVDGDLLRCPFHGWQLDGAGRVRSIPTNDKLPSARHTSWEVKDYYGMIVIYHAEHAPDRVLYRLPTQPSIDSGELIFRGRHAGGEVDMHIIEFAENAVDFQHFGEIHDVMHLPWTRLRIPFVKIHHQTSWATDDALSHRGYFRDRSYVEIFGRPMPRAGAAAEVIFHGPASIVQFDFEIGDIGQMTMFQTHTPVAPLKQQVHFSWFSQKRIPRLLASYVVGNWVSQWGRDVEIWENKIYRSKPLLSRSDGPVHNMRRWYRQFYAE